MNKQIKNLLMEARLFCYTDGTVSLFGETYCGQAEIEKFAELIVEKCAKHAEHAKGTDVEFEAYFKAMVLGVEEQPRKLVKSSGMTLGQELKLMSVGRQSSDNSWVANPDRMGGCFTQDEINEAGAWK